jgi:hypothetical protein
MRTHFISRLGTSASRAASLIAAAAVFFTISITAHAAGSLWFQVTVSTVNGDANVPQVVLYNASRTESITHFTMTIGDLSKGFDAAFVYPPPGVTFNLIGLDANDDGGARRQVVELNFFPGIAPGQSVYMYVDVDNSGGNAGLDFRTVLFNNGAADNSVVTVESGTGATASLTMNDPGTQTDCCYSFDNIPPSRTVRVTSVAEAAGGNEYVARTTAKLFNGVDLIGSPYESIGVEQIISVYEGETVEISAPQVVYKDIHGVYLSDSVLNPTDLQNLAEERFAAAGISVNDIAQTGDPTYYRFTVTNDAFILVKWNHDYALTVHNNFDLTQSLERDSAGNPWAGPLDSQAVGNADPPAQKQWKRKGETIIAKIEGAVISQTHPGLSLRFVPKAYRAFGPANRDTDSTTYNSDRLNSGIDVRTDSAFVGLFPFIVGQAPPQYQQVPQFTMYGPAGITYVWQIQYGINMQVDDPGRAALLKIFQVSDTGDTEVGNLAGTFWFDPGTPLKVGTAANAADGNSTALVGWIGGDGYYFGTQGTIDSSNGNLTEGAPATRADGSAVAQWVNQFLDPANLKPYRGLFIPDLQRPANVQWRYGPQSFTVNVVLGEYVFQTDAAHAAVFTNQPDAIAKISVSGANQNVGNNDMTIWDPQAAKLYPLVPGSFRATWKADPSGVAVVDVNVNVTYPSPNPHYRHVTGTPPVALDADPADNFIFKGLKYTENSAVVDGDKMFTADNPGKSVLLFSEIQTVGRASPAEFLRVRVVESKNYNNALASDGTCVVGRKITDAALDKANLGTGFILFENARYNPFIYDAAKLDGLAAKDIYDIAALHSNSRDKIVLHKDLLPGPIIPVNLHPSAPANQRIVVVWYDDPALNDGLLWPYQARRYLPSWPTTAAQGLGRIVIASQDGSDGVDASGNDQQVVPAFGIFSEETTYNPTRLQQVQVYSQPNPTQPGYNPNEEHGLMAPSRRFNDVSPIPPTVYALRNNDLNTYTKTSAGENNQPALYTSHPYVLVQFFDTAENEFKMRVYSVQAEDQSIGGYKFADQPTVTTNNTGIAAATPLALRLQPHLIMEAGEPVIPFYPLIHVIGASPCADSFGINIKKQATYWRDHKNTFWSVSGGTNAWFTLSTYYPLAPDFYWPPNKPGFFREVLNGQTVQKVATVPQVGDCVAFVPSDVSDLLNRTPEAVVDVTMAIHGHVDPIKILYKSEWPANPAVLKAGETLTFNGGEFRADNPTRPIINQDNEIEAAETPGLPQLLAFACAEVAFDSLNPFSESGTWKSNWTARVAQVLDKREVPLKLLDFPPDLAPATKRTRVKGGKYVFAELPASLQKRIRYDSLLGKLQMYGRLNNKEIGDDSLTAAPPAVYVLEPNILTDDDKTALLKLSANQKWIDAINDLVKLTRNPGLVDNDNAAIPVPTAGNYRAALETFWRNYYTTVGNLPAGGVVPLPVPIPEIDDSYLVGLEPKILREENGTPVTIEDPAVPGLRRVVSDVRQAAPVRAFGPGLALIPNADFLDPLKNLPDISWVTVVENNDPSLGGSPITLHVIQVSRNDRYRGSIKTIASDNVFDENLVLRHTGDFGANADKLFFEWWYRPDDGSLNVPPPDLVPAGQPNPWKLFPDPTGKRGQGRYEILMKGNPNAPETLLADSFWFVRYRHTNDATEGTNWKVPQPGGASAVNFVWAGAGNSQPFVDLDLDGFKDFRAQLAQGWIKRVLDRVNPYEARINDFEGDYPSTRSSMIAEFGPRFEGPVALNPDKNVIENVGLIELYETILKRGRDLSIDLSQPFSTPAVANALQLASTRIADFYQILGNEAYTDSLDPTIGFGSHVDGAGFPGGVDYGTLAPAVFAFQNQLSSLLEEELALLRGVDDYFARPVYNRLFWNFTQGEGTAAYAINYNIQDINLDGFIDEDDAMIMYPMGHGDAWGHYLTALRNQYELLRHPYFNWVSRSEFYNLQDIIIKVDFLDERKFAQAAAAKAKAGAEIVNLTYRQKYVENSDAQWQGYTDSNKDRSWGVDEWARRAGQGAYFDWVTANALLPAKHPNDTLEGIQKVDRTVNSDIQVVSANMNAIQRTIDEANKGQNPLGLDRNALVFDIDPTFLEVGSTAQIGTRAVQGLLHLDQIYERALKMIENAVAVWDNANESQNMLRQVGNGEQEFLNATFQEDLSFKNDLIQIFGKPYEGTIGPGKIYPAGYDGPDLLTFMYVDVRELNTKTVPGPTADFGVFDGNNLVSGQIYDAYNNAVGGSAGHSLTSISPDTRRLFSPSFVEPSGGGSASALLRDGLYGVQYTDLLAPKVAMSNLTQLLPVTAAGYTFQAPRDWGQRRAVGDVQLQISKMLQQEAAIAEAIGAWDSLQGGIVRQLRLLNAKVQTSDDIRARNEAFIRSKYIITSLIQGTEGVRAALKVTDTTLELVEDAVQEGVPGVLPTAGLAVSPGDALSFSRAGFEIAAIPGEVTIASLDGVLAAVKLAAEIGLNIAENEVNLANDADERALAKKESLVELENLVGDEPIRRITIFKEIQALREMSDEYRGMIDAGSRKVDERAAFNKRVAAQTQRHRYQDMTFRVARNYSLQTYRSAFDLAAKYSYLAAKAYDYETNFDPSDPGSPNAIFADIIRARTLGNFDEGEPRLGAGGLCEALAKLKENYEVLKGQLGINNPQIEIGKASLRTENFRILPSNGGTDVASVHYITNNTANQVSITEVVTLPNGSSQQPTNALYGYPAAGSDSDELWKQTLQSAVVPDLWQVPEYRQFCRPFAAEADANGNHVAEPGIVIRFATHIGAGKNMFGKPLTGGDHAFDPTHFATKIQSAGIWFSDYLSSDPLNDLPATPRVYLVPVGNDIMSVPTSANPDNIRIWKVLDQSIPVPLPATTANFNSTTWIPVIDGLNGRLGQGRKYSTFRAYHNGGSEVDFDELVADTRLVARSVWNTQWVLIVPGRLLNYDPNVGLQRFIDQVTDIKLVFRSYGISGN